MGAYDKRRHRACNASKQVSFPRHSGLTGQYAPKDGAVEKTNDESRRERHERSIYQTARNKKAEPPEYQSRCADMDCRASEKPNERTPEDDNDPVYGQESACRRDAEQSPHQ